MRSRDAISRRFSEGSSVVGGYTAVIFDLDGTLLNTLDDLADSVNYALTQYGLPARSTKEVCRFVGNGVRRLMTLAVPGGEAHEQFEEIFACFKKRYYDNSVGKTRPYDGIEALLQRLREGGFAMAVVSNKFDAAVADLNQRFFAQYIPVAIGERADLKRKPAPDMVLEAIRLLGKQKKECVYIGDSEVDIATAKNTGIDCISVLWGFRDRAELEQNGAACFAQTPEELAALLTNCRAFE